MRLPRQRWLQVVCGATALVFVGVAIYLYAFRFFDWLESDAAVTALLGDKLLAARSPIVADWYYGNGDVWVIAPHLISAVPVAILGLGPAALWIAVVIGFALEMFALVKVYARLGGELWLGVLAAIVTLTAWSSSHVKYEYIQLGYGWVTAVCMLMFSWFAALSTRPAPIWKWLAASAVIALIAMQNPTRSVAYSVGPIIAMCAWPWRGLGVRRRIALAGAVCGGFAVAFVAYTKLVIPNVSFSRGHLDFVFVHSVDELAHNLAFLAGGLAELCGGGTDVGLRVVPGALLLVGGFALVIREALSSREPTAMRLVCVMVLAQAAIVLLPLVVGNLLVDQVSVRYLMPSMVEAFGLAAILAVRAVEDGARRWVRGAAIAWLAVVPVAAVAALPETPPPAAQRYVWPDAAELDALGNAIVQRGLTRGYAIVQAANLLTVDTHGNALVCPIYFSDIIWPERWLTDTACFAPSKVPDRFFVVLDRDEHSRSAVRATLPAPAEVFRVGDAYEVYVYRTADVSLAWLELPLPDNDRNAFPMHVPATYLQIRRGKVAVEGSRLAATGQTGPVVYGPYIKLPRGSYTVTWRGNGIASSGEIKFFATAGGSEILDQLDFLATKIPAEPQAIARLKFKLEAPRDAIEFMVYSQDGGRVALDELVIERR